MINLLIVSALQLSSEVKYTAKRDFAYNLDLTWQSLFSHSVLQDFDWLISKTVKGDTKIKIISTFEARYSDPSYSKRVASGDISVVRLADNEVELKIAEVKSQDAGFYWCQTPSTDSIMSGNYDAQVQLIGTGECVWPFCPFTVVVSVCM